MNRKEFLKKTMWAGTLVSALPGMLSASENNPHKSTFSKMIDQVGFNHLPNKELHTMNTVLHKADSRGHANHGWLDTHHTFSFANYHNPDRMHFGVLRVLNDDQVAAGRGFGTHPHDNMEIISIPLEGDLEHKDSLGNQALIKQGDIQVMSAGTGVYHSEKNKNTHSDVKFLQIWIFPNKKDVPPRYDQISIEQIQRKNAFFQILSPSESDQGVWIHQNAWFHLGEFEAGKKDQYELKSSSNGVYAFVLEGEVKIEGQILHRRDGFGVWDTNKIDFQSLSKARVLLMEVPMSL